MLSNQKKFPLSLMVAITVFKSAYGNSQSTNTFKLLYDGNLVIDGTYTDVPATFLIQCVGACKQTQGCWVLTWDRSRKECQLLNELVSPVTTTVPTHATQRTYYVSGMNGKNIVKTAAKAKWWDQRDKCVDMGGRLFLPTDQTYSYLIYHLYNEVQLFIGAYRDPTDSKTTWYNMDGNLINTDLLKWYSNQPNNSGGDQFYLVLHKGELYDLEGNVLLYGICEV